MLNQIENWKPGQTGNQVAKTGIHIRQTEAPQPYTEALLLGDMKSAAKFIKQQGLREALKNASGGIGTPATRASIIETLKARQFVVEAKGKIRSTPEGRVVIKGVCEELADPGMTAAWEEMLSRIERGETVPDDFMKLIEAQLHKMIVASDQAVFGFPTSEKSRPSAGASNRLEGVVCPRCRGVLSINDRWLRCEKGDFILFREVAKKILSETNLIELVKNGKTGVVDGFISKAGKPFGASLELDGIQEDGKAKVKFVFPDRRT